MKFKFLLFVTLLFAFQLIAINSVKAQTKEELQELLNSPSATKKIKEKKKKKAPKEEVAEPVKVEQKKEEPKQEVKTEPVKVEEKKDEPKQEVKPAPVVVEQKKEEPKTEPAKVEKKEEPKPATKTEPVKPEVKKEEPKPAAKTEPAKKEEAKPVVKKEPAKVEKKEEPKPAAKTEPAKEEPKPVVQPEPVKVEKIEEPQREEVVVAEPRSTEIKAQNEIVSASGEKLKELPSPDKVGFGKSKKLGKQLFERGSIYNGLKYYEAALAKKPKKTFINQPLADGYFLVRDYAAAKKYYKTLVDLDSVKHKNLFALYQYALTEKYLGNYEVAKENFNKFNKLAKDNDEFAEQRKNANREAQGCDLGITYRNNTDLLKYKTAHLGESINQQFTDYSPFLKDANTLYFGSWVSDKVILENKKEKYGTFSRIYKAIKKGNVWTKAEEAQGEVNTVQAHTGNAAFSQDGNTIYYTQCLQDDKQNMRCNIYRGKWTNDGWSAGEKLNVNAEGATTTQPALGKNEAGENVLYFASDRTAGKGMDIFYSKISADGSLGKPQNAGNTINTKGEDLTPFYDFKTNTLYFSSNGHVNIGGTDIFKTTVKGGEWMAPENLGTPVNSSVDDMYFMWNDQSELGFVVSNRTGGFGLKSANCCDDIYQVDLNRIYLAVKGTQTNADNKDEVITNGLVSLYDEASGQELKSFYATDGTYLFDLEHDKNYKITARKTGFTDLTFSTSTMGKRANDTVTVNFSMKEIPGFKSKVGEKIGTAYWEFNKDNLTQSAPDTLNHVVAFMSEYPQYVLEVGSHTDNKGSDEYNLKLSKRRSDAVLKYLLSKKIPSYRLESKAYGESQPAELNENPPGTDNPDGRTKNRRTEFKVISELTAEQQLAKQAEEEAAIAKKKKFKKATAVSTK
jgi:OOP family OmpA-OmpF porin